MKSMRAVALALLFVVTLVFSLVGPRVAAAQGTTRAEPRLPYTPVVTPNGSALPWTMNDGVKEFRLTAEPVKRELAKGMVVNAWGDNGSTPGPTIET